MISHRHKCIFIHIPKAAGSSIEYYFKTKPFNWKEPNFETLVGWDPKRKIHLQHATAKQLLELELISEDTWKEYFKFSFVRNPWSRAYSDYFWMINDTGIKDSFENFIQKKGDFKKVLSDDSRKEYRGDHLIPQTDFLFIDGVIAVDYFGKQEHFNHDFDYVKKALNLSHEMNFHEKKSSHKHSHYSKFYSPRTIQLIQEKYQNDIKNFSYTFDDKRSWIQKLFSKSW